MYEKIIEETCDIALLAGEQIMQIYNGVDDLHIEYKSDHSPLTIADKNSNEIINEGLNNLDIQYPIISEENRQIEYEVRKHYNRFWLVDPLDGTKEFIKRNGEFTVNIALIEDGYPIMGVVYVPATNQLYFSHKNEGSYKIENGHTKRIRVMEFDMTDSGIKVVCSRSHINEETKSFMDKLNGPQTIHKGSSIKFLIIAEGRAHLYPRLGPTMEWDTGAAQAVLEEAGGRVIHHETHQRLNYNKSSLLNPYFFAVARINGELHI